MTYIETDKIEGSDYYLENLRIGLELICPNLRIIIKGKKMKTWENERCFSEPLLLNFPHISLSSTG